MASDAIERIYAGDTAEFHNWLAANHASASAVWLVLYKKVSHRAGVSWGEAVDEALCVGWVDSKVRRLDDERYEQYFTPRRRTSAWSRINKEKVGRLIAEGRMEEAGLRAVEVAKENGSWAILDGPNVLVVPDDLAEALDAEPAARRGYEAFSASTKRATLAWIALAKRPETRARRISKTVTDAAAGRRPAA